MIICSCNVLSDHDIRNVVTEVRKQPLSAEQVYACLGCTIRCGRCARAIKRIMSEALSAYGAASGRSCASCRLQSRSESATSTPGCESGATPHQRRLGPGGR